jgi:DNA-binding NtrC family response regulator
LYPPEYVDEAAVGKRMPGRALATPVPTTFACQSEWLLGSMVGRSAVVQRLFSQMRYTARHLRLATIEGEAGTGKSLAARTLHDLGPSADAPFISCPAGQFFNNGPAIASLTPLIKDARNGTLFLSHVEELSLDQQARLLTFLQWLDHQHARQTPVSVPRHVFFSARESLRKLSASPGFRADLCHRLSTIRFAIPPLRERRDDLPLLADFFAQRFSMTHGKPVRGLGPQALPRLSAYDWPGNARELENVIHSAALRCEGQWIRPIDISALTPAQPAAILPSAPAAQDDPNLDRAILRHIHQVLARVEGNKLRAARLLGISRSTLYRLLDSGDGSTNNGHGKIQN